RAHERRLPPARLGHDADRRRRGRGHRRGVGPAPDVRRRRPPPPRAPPRVPRGHREPHHRGGYGRARMTEPVVRAKGVVKRWGSTTALAGVDAEIGPGVTGLLGSNAAGKTTFLGLVLGLHRQDAGLLEMLGLDPTTSGPEVRARLG